MIIEVKKFGFVLTSRPSGKNSFDAFRPSLAAVSIGEDVIVDFAGINSLSPSWADEFLTPLYEEFGERLILQNTENPSVRLTLETLEEINHYNFRRG
ncbi:STAS-like domain-containing protein [Patescibacteria group bacterium]|nr:STAS-like domain-containing protein [Patescibacteria group bacterium]MBU1029129.1 STAS-like domain-containing protein [Patescibacteria group bacterium]